VALVIGLGHSKVEIDHMRTAMRRLSIRISAIVHTIRFRLALWFVAILGLVLVSFSAFIYVRQSQALRAQSINHLQSQVRKLEDYFRYSNRESFEHNPIQFPSDPSNGEPLLQQGDVLAITGPNGGVLGNWGPITSKDINQLATIGFNQGVSTGTFSYTIVSATAAGQQKRSQYTFIITPVSFAGNLVGFIILGSPIDPGNQLQRLLITLILGTLAILVGAMAGGYWLADRAMHPVRVITQMAREIGETDLSRRLNLGTKDELGELANTFDAMLARLQAAFERQRQFTADASHELRTPLTIVNLESSRALEARRSLTEYRRALTVIQAENEWMTRLVNNLLTLARMDAGQAKLKLERLDLSDVALDVVERMAPLANQKDVKLEAGELPELIISGDRQFLSQMLTNLVDNAIKYADGSDCRVKIESGLRSTETGEKAWVRVIDNGPGISSQHLAHIFERFYRVDQARSHDNITDNGDGENAPSGSGLGLSIVQWVAQAHGGWVSVDSRPDSGTAFEIILPLAVPMVEE
jgi:signal transduction histidine kinase